MKLYTTSLFCLSFLSACATIGEEEDADVSEDDSKGGDGDGDSLTTGGNTGDGSGGSTLGSGGSTLGSGGSTLGSGGSTFDSGGSTLGSGGDVAGAGGSTVAGDCNDSNSTVAVAGDWTTIPAVPCMKVVVPDYVYVTVKIKIQNNDGNVAGTVSVAGTNYTKSFGDISSVNAQTAILDLERSNSVAMPHGSPYYVKIDGNLTGQQLAWEIEY